MLLGATVLCFLVLLVLLAERLGSTVWQGETTRGFYRCEACDLRYPAREVSSAARRAVCPAGHVIVRERSRTSAGAVAIVACVGFLAVAIVLMLTGVVPN